MATQNAIRKIVNFICASPMKSEFTNPLKVGDILYTSTYLTDDTRVNFYEVIEVRGKKIFLRQLAQKTTETGMMCGYTRPVPGEYDENFSEVIQRIVKPDDCKQGFRVKIHYKGYGELWDGGAQYCSWYR